MRVVRTADAAAFLERVGPFLVAREAEHNLILGLAARLCAEPLPYGYPAYLASVERGDEVVSVALRTPPHNLVLSGTDDERAVAAIAADVHPDAPTLPGALGPKAAVACFVDEWRRLRGGSTELALAERIYRAARIVAPQGVAGAMRAYEPSDRRLVVDWLGDFVAEAMPGAPLNDPAGILERRLAEPEAGVVLWEDGVPVSLAAFGGLTPSGIRVGPVYTPPELRGRGYASALTAALTEQLLETRRFCFLFTDLANPTSNSIYRRIGYEPISDVDQWSFRYALG